ncbi:hypothetical protein PAGU2638_13010 [Lysobacter sp. PAGU 2638]
MRLSAVLVSAVLVVTALPPLPAHADGAALMWQCRYALDADSAKGSAEAMQAGNCMGYVSAVLDTSAFYESNGATPAPLKCLPDDVIVGDAVKAVRDYLESHEAEQKNASELAVTIRALQARYPCKGAK